MAISPEDITSKTFQNKFMGVHPDEVKSHLENVAAEFRQLQERVTGLERTVAEQQASMKRAADDQRAFEDVTRVFKDNIEKLKSELRVKEQNGTELLKGLDSMRHQVEQVRKEKEGLQGELNTRDTRISELESTYRMSRAAVDELRKKLVLLETENSALRTEAAEHERQLSKAREELGDLSERAHHDSSRLLEAAKDEIERMRRNASLEIVQLRNDIEQLTARRSQVYTELRALLDEHMRRLDDFMSGSRTANGDPYDNLFERIDFAELAEFEEDPLIEADHAEGGTGPDEADSDTLLKNRLEDGGIAYLSGE